MPFSLPVIWHFIQALVAAYLSEIMGRQFIAGVLTTLVLSAIGNLLIRRYMAHRPPVIAEPESSPPISPKLPIDLEAVKELGIIACVPSLEHSDWTPTACRQRVHRSLKFSGVQGSKWVESEAAIEDFRHFLNRLKMGNGASVQFLVVNPFGRAMEDIVKSLGVPFDVEAELRILSKFVALMDEFPTILDVRLFEHRPYFRIVIIDEAAMAVSRYKLWAGRKVGWEAPHLIIENDKRPDTKEAISLFYAFEQHFEHVFEDLSTPVRDVLEITARRVKRRS